MLVVLDSGPLGDLVNPNNTRRIREIQTWMRSHLSAGVRFCVPEIADFEVRRSLTKVSKRTVRKQADQDKVDWAKGSIRNLDALGAAIGYAPLSTETMRHASHLWADARIQGIPTAHDLELDCDVILAAQAIIKSGEKEQVFIATINVGHLSRYDTSTVSAKNWKDI